MLPKDDRAITTRSKREREREGCLSPVCGHQLVAVLYVLTLHFYSSLVNGSPNGLKNPDVNDNEKSKEEKMSTYARENLVGTEAVVKGPFGRKQESKGRK